MFIDGAPIVDTDLIIGLEVVHGAELAEGSAGSEVREMQIALDHLKRRMSKDSLKSIDVSAVAEIVSGESMT